jgi:hypothetical protein
MIQAQLGMNEHVIVNQSICLQDKLGVQFKVLSQKMPLLAQTLETTVPSEMPIHHLKKEENI